MGPMGHILTHPVERQLTHPIHRKALAYWRECRRLAGGIPGRQDIDPVDIPGLLRWVNLVEVHRRPGGLAFRHRLVGTGIVEVRNSDSTGLWFHELYDPAKLARLQPALEEVAQTGEPALISEDLGDIGKPHRTMSSLVMPLASDRRRVDMLLVVSQYDRA